MRPDIPLIPVKEEAVGRFVAVFLTSLPIEKRNLRCINCGWVVCQYQNEAGFIMESGDKPMDKGCIEVQCRRCKLTYRIVM